MNYRTYLTPIGSTLPVAALAAMLLSFLSVSDLQGQLLWENPAKEKELELGQSAARVLFPFENTGDYPVTIVSTSACCGSSVNALEQKTYYPGEKGEIALQINVGGRTGVQRYAATVRTDDPSAQVANLTATVTIPAIVTIAPRLVHWRVGQERDTKVVSIRLNPDLNLKIIGYEIDGDKMQVVLKEGENPHEYLVEVTPLEKNSRGRAIISLQTDPEMENRHNFSFYAYVR